MQLEEGLQPDGQLEVFPSKIFTVSVACSNLSLCAMHVSELFANSLSSTIHGFRQLFGHLVSGSRCSLG